jgi:hypothetical protein
MICTCSGGVYYIELKAWYKYMSPFVKHAIITYTSVFLYKPLVYMEPSS